LEIGNWQFMTTRGLITTRRQNTDVGDPKKNLTFITRAGVEKRVFTKKTRQSFAAAFLYPTVGASTSVACCH
jgi:hypothetical protein